MSHHPPVPPCCECGAPGKIVEDDDGYTVVCTNRYCDGVPPLSQSKATPTKAAAWNQWRWEQTGVCR